MSRPITTRIEHDLGDDLASTIPADTPPPPRSSFSYGLQPRIVPPSRSSTYPGGNGYPSASSPPTTDTIRLDAIQDTHGQALPPPPPVPSSQSLPYAARAPQMRGGHPTGGHDSNGVGYNGAGSNGAASNGAASNGAVVAGAKEVVVSDQAYVRLPMGNPHTATELAIRKPTVPAHLLPQSLTRAAQNYTPAIIVGGDERRSRRSLFVVAGATAVITLLAAFTFIYMRREGVLEVEVRDPAGASVPVAQVYVDGRKVCEAMPCIVRDVEPGRHGVRVVTANSPDNEPVSVEVTPGSVAKISVALRPSLASLVAESDQPGVRLFVDGVDRGTLPAKITDLAPGKHEIQLTGDRYKSTQRSIEVKAGESADLGGIKLDVSKGRVLLAPKTEGADILLVPNDDLARAKRVKGPFPFAVDVVIPGDKWKLVAKKQGYPDFVVPIDFSDGVPEKTIEISFGNNDKVALNVDSLPTTPSGPAPAPNPKSSPAADPPSRPEKDDSAAASTGMATLNINSLPVSRILLDGQPMGETPRTGIQVTPGTHTVTFVHPELGKKSVSVNVKAGESKAVSTRLRAD
jgi:serine/threonine-protein kinase